jgi:hypothetical protein
MSNERSRPGYGQRLTRVLPLVGQKGILIAVHLATILAGVWLFACGRAELFLTDEHHVVVNNS